MHTQTKGQESNMILQTERPKNLDSILLPFACIGNIHKLCSQLFFLVQIQVVLGSFLYGMPKSKTKNKDREESDLGEKDSTQSGTMLAQIQHQNLTVVPPESWPGSQMLDMRTSSIDINLTRG
jgi:hypothetical protein